MKNFLKKFMGGVIIALGLGAVFATNYIRTSFYKAGNPITLPATQFVSGGTVSGNYTSGGTLLMQIGQSGANYSFIPLLDANGDAYITGGALGNYVTLAMTGDRNDAYSWIQTNSGDALYFVNNSGDYLLVANSGDYYTSNPLGYITGGALSGYLTGFTETDPVRMAASGDFVPYTGATSLVDLGVQSVRASNIKVQLGGMGMYSTYLTGNVGYGNINGTQLYIYNSNGYGWILDLSKLTEDRLIYLPDATGTILLDTTLAPYLSGFLTGFTESDPIFMQNSGDFYLATNPEGYITGVDLSSYLTGDQYRKDSGVNLYPIEDGKGVTVITGNSWLGMVADTLNLMLMGNPMALPVNMLMGAIDVPGMGAIPSIAVDAGIWIRENPLSPFNPLVALINQTGDYGRRMQYDSQGTQFMAFSYLSGDQTNQIPIVLMNPDGRLQAGFSTLGIIGSNPLDYVTVEYLTGLGFLTGYTEADPVFLAQSGDYYTSNPLGYITGEALSGFLTGQIWERNSNILTPVTGYADIQFQVGLDAEALGVGSIALGVQSKAYGISSTSIGNALNNYADYGTVIGYQNDMATGSYYSTILGQFNDVIGEQSTVLGINNDVTVPFATVLGRDINVHATGGTAIGFNAEVFGFEGTAIGTFAPVARGYRAMALGNQAIANGDNSVAIGYQSVSYLDYSHALGYKALAKSPYSIAIGVEADAFGQYSTAIGYQASTTDVRAMSIGYASQANGPDSYSIGNGTIASSTGSFAMGTNTKAIGQYASTLGYGGQAIGNYSFAGGLNSIATGANSFAYGNGAKTIGTSSVAIGGAVQAIGASSIAMGDSSKAIGDGSIAIGVGNISTGDYSTSIGFQNGTVAAHSTVIGDSSSAEGGYSYAIGNQAIASGNSSFVFGSDIVAGGENSFAIGGLGEANGKNAFSIGNNTHAIGTGAFAIGNEGYANGELSTTMGYMCVANGKYSTAIGYATTGAGEASMAMGYETLAIGDYSTAFGRGTAAYGYASIAGGLNSVATGQSSLARGSTAQALARNATAFGDNVVAKGEFSTAFGISTLASGTAATSFGSAAESREDYSTAFGLYTLSKTIAGTSFGKYNIGLTNALLEVGYGTGTSNRDNALTILDNGNMGIKKSNPQYTLDVSGSIQTNVAMYITGGTAPFRFALSGGLVEAQYYTGGVWTTAVVYTLP